MFIKKIKYTDFLGTEREETFYFNLNEAELMKMNMLQDGRLGNVLEEMVKAKNSREMWMKFENLILTSYGELSTDGRSLVKKKGELAEAFTETLAYDALINWFLEDQKNIEDFVKGIIPSELTTTNNDGNPMKQDNKPQIAVVK